VATDDELALLVLKVMGEVYYHYEDYVRVLFEFIPMKFFVDYMRYESDRELQSATLEVVGKIITWLCRFYAEEQ